MSELLQQLIDEKLIRDAMARYARAVDRSDWDGVRAAYHPGAYDDHGEYKGDIDGLIAWLEDRFADFVGGMHFLGNSLIEFAGPDLALVETYFISHRLPRPPAGEGPRDSTCRQGWGRYVDRFERRDGEWRVAHRTVTMDSAFTFALRDGSRQGPAVWGTRDGSDRLYECRSEIFGAP